MKAEKFLELNKAKGLAVLTATTIIVLYITKNLFLVPEILMVFLGATALIKLKVDGVSLNEKKSELKKGVYFSIAGLILGFAAEKFFGVNLIVEIVLLFLLFAVIKEVYSKKESKWVNAFVLMGSVLIVSGIILLIKFVLTELI
ncbi:MAG: hypothetical protein ABIJ74_03805 [archaeon]